MMLTKDFLLCGLLLALPGSPVTADDPPPAVFDAAARVLVAPFVPVVQDEGGGEGEEEDESDEEVDETTERYYAVVGGDVYTGLGTVLRGATILANKGKITQIGLEVDIPEGATILDATGMRVYPGLVAFTSSGLLGGSGDFSNSADPFHRNMVLGLAGGITTTEQSNTVVKLKRFQLEGMIVKSKPFATFSFSTRNPASKRSLREKLERASKYLREYRSWEKKVRKQKDLKEPSKRGVDANVLRVLKGEVRAKFNADEREELLGIAQLAMEYGFQPLIEGCYEGWTVADELGRAGAMAVVTPRQRRTKDERLSVEAGSSIENAAILYESGVPVSIVPQGKGIDLSGIVGRDIMHLPIEAAFAVRGGLPEQAALEAITIEPARMLGVSHRVGSLEVGKDCDLIVTDGDILHYETFVQYAVVDGRLVYDKEKELFFAHIRPRPEAALAPEEKVDKGEEPPDDEDDEGDDD